MIQAAPFILPLAEALGLSVATLGMAKVTDEINKYIQENPEQAQKLITTIMPAQGIASMFKGKDDDNLPEKTEETKLPKKEPPEDPNILPELAKQTAEEVIRKEIKKKEPLNKITTWEDLFPTIEEAKKVSKEHDISLENLEKEIIKKKITFKKTGNMGGQYFNVLYDGKEIAELAPLEEKFQGLKEYNIVFTLGEMDVADTVTGLAQAKEKVKKYIANGLLDKSEPSPAPYYWEPLRKKFEEATFDKKGNYINMPTKEEQLEYQKSLVEKKLKKAHGGLIDKPFTGNSRYI
jgi:hypothetical protein